MQRRKSGKLPKEAKGTLKSWWCDHIVWPYPTVCTRLPSLNEAPAAPL